MHTALTILARLSTRNDKWLNDTIFSSFPDKTERATMLADCSGKAVEAAYVLPNLSAFSTGNSWNMAAFEIAN